MCRDIRIPRLSSLSRVILVVLISLVIGMTAGFAKVYAETLNSVNIPGAGNVGTAFTTGTSSGGIRYGWGGSSSSVTLYYVYASTRLWHIGNLDHESYQSCNWCKTANTTAHGTAISGDPFGGRSAFRYSTSSGSAVYYTSWPDYSASCSNYWYNGVAC